MGDSRELECMTSGFVYVSLSFWESRILRETITSSGDPEKVTFSKGEKGYLTVLQEGPNACMAQGRAHS